MRFLGSLIFTLLVAVGSAWGQYKCPSGSTPTNYGVTRDSTTGTLREVICQKPDGTLVFPSGVPRYATDYTGVDAAAKITACDNALPSTGGTCDAQGLAGAQTIHALNINVSHVHIVLGAATYSLTNTLGPSITVNANDVEIDCHGTIFKAASGAGKPMIGLATTTDISNFRMHGCELDGSSANTLAYAIHGAGTHNVIRPHIYDNYIHDVPGGNGIFLSNPSEAFHGQISHNRFARTAAIVFGHSGVAEMIIDGNEAFNPTDAFISVQQNASGNPVENVVITNNVSRTEAGSGIHGGAIEVLNAKKVIVANNILINPYQFGIYVHSAQPDPTKRAQDVLISNNIVMGVQNLGGIGTGIELQGVDRVSVTNNRIESCYTYGIAVDTPTTDSQIIGNYIRNNGQVGAGSFVAGIILSPAIYGKGVVANNTAIDDQVSATQGFGIQFTTNGVAADLVTIAGNIAVGNTTGQIAVTGGYAGKLVKYGNQEGSDTGFVTNTIEANSWSADHIWKTTQAGGQEWRAGFYFDGSTWSLKDVTNNRIPISVAAGAPNNSLTISVTGDGKVLGGFGAGGLVEYADNAAALAGGLAVGAFYRTADALKVVH